MSERPHRILRQVVELQVPRGTDPHPVQEIAGRLVRERLAPMMERSFDALAESGSVVRLDRVEIELGTLSHEDFETAFAQACERCVTAQVTEAIRDAKEDPGSGLQNPLGSRLELLEQFVRTGTVPWWADPSDPALIPDALGGIISEESAQLAAWLGGLVKRGGQMRRLIHACSDADLVALTEMVAPMTADRLLLLARELRDSTAGGGKVGGVSDARLRRIVWEGVLRVASRPTGGDPDRRVLDWVATELGISVNSLANAVRKPAAGSFPGATPAERWERILGELRTCASESSSSPKSLADNLHGLLGRMPVSAAVLGQWLARVPNSTSGPEARVAEAVRTVLRELAAVPVDEGPEGADILRSEEPSAGDAVHVGNAGLVLLWPFLERFFEHLGLVVDHHFRDEAGRQRAVGLLQLLASGDPEPPEYRLPLNKVLCGMPVGDVFEPGGPFSAKESSECEALLAAVLQQAPMLGRLSPAGLQGSFLLRPGQLGAIEGAWLQRVQRETFDVVLEQLPWPLTWVRLPWMPMPIQVEWL